MRVLERTAVLELCACCVEVVCLLDACCVFIRLHVCNEIVIHRHAGMGVEFEAAEAENDVLNLCTTEST